MHHSKLAAMLCIAFTGLSGAIPGIHIQFLSRRDTWQIPLIYNIVKQGVNTRTPFENRTGLRNEHVKHVEQNPEPVVIYDEEKRGEESPDLFLIYENEKREETPPDFYFDYENEKRGEESPDPFFIYEKEKRKETPTDFYFDYGTEKREKKNGTADPVFFYAGDKHE